MKFSLTITDATKEEILAIMTGNPPGLAGLAASTALVHTTGHTTAPTSNVPMPQNGNGADDDGPANTNAPAVDSAGLRWDDRIHSKNKALNADGTWRKRRNVDAALVASVEAELRGQPVLQQQTMQQMPMTQQPVMQSQPQMQQMPMPNGVPPMPDQQMQQPQMMQQMPMTQQPQMMQQPVQMDFNAFMTHLAGQMTKRDQAGAPLITTDYLAGVAQKLSQAFGRQFNSITDIAGDANVIAHAVNLITLDGRWS
jgi:hypothetical protein